MSRRHETDTIAIGIDHAAWFFDALSCNNQFAIAARCCGRQRFGVMVEFYDRAQRVVPVLLLPAANRQYVVEAKAGILLPETQHRLQIVRRKSEVDDVLCELHLLRRQLKEVPEFLGNFPKSRCPCRVAYGGRADGRCLGFRLRRRSVRPPRRTVQKTGSASRDRNPGRGSTERPVDAAEGCRN